jgi:hypothetical protein
MDELNLNVGDQTDGGSPASQPGESHNQQAPIDGDKLLELLEGKFASKFDELSKNLTGQLSGLQKVQGDIDRSRNEFKTRLEQLNKLTKQGLSQDEAIERLDAQDAERNKFEELKRELADLKSLIAGNGGAGGQNTVTQVFQQYGLDVKDPRVAPALTKQYANKQDMEFAALKLFHEIQSSPNPNAAQQPAMTGGAGRRDAKDISNITDPAELYRLAEQELFGKR